MTWEAVSAGRTVAVSTRTGRTLASESPDWDDSGGTPWSSSVVSSFGDGRPEGRSLSYGLAHVARHVII